MADAIDNAEDLIDSRDVIARIEELEGDRAAIVEEMEDPEAPEAVPGTLAAELAAWDASEDAEELAALKALASEGENYAPDWRYGATLIRHSHFRDYAEELAEDIGAIKSDAGWPLMHIDWEAAADALKIDYTEIDFGGVAYYVR